MERLNKFGLKLNQSKTRLLEFGRFATRNYEAKKKGKPETFDFLGFTHYCSTRLSDGGFTLGRKTIAKKMKAKLLDIKQALRVRIHQDVYTQGRWLKAVIQGFYNYHAVPGNRFALDGFKTAISKIWLRNLKRRSQKSRMNWKRLTKLIRMFIPQVKIVHPYPNHRLIV
jgi:hypothetical protein